MITNSIYNNILIITINFTRGKLWEIINCYYILLIQQIYCQEV